MREEGFYWVRISDEWIIAEYSNKLKGWWISGITATYHEPDFEEIDERQIKR